MFERFTDAARRVVVYAQEESRLLGHDYIGTEHVLLGLLHEDTEAAQESLGNAGVTLDAARAEISSSVGPGKGTSEGNIPFTPRAKKVLELSLREALQLGHNYIGSEHVLLGLLREGEGAGVRALEHLGADRAELRADILTMLRSLQQPFRPRGRFTAGSGGLPEIETRLTAIEDRLERIERLLRDGSGRDSA